VQFALVEWVVQKLLLRTVGWFSMRYQFDPSWLVDATYATSTIRWLLLLAPVWMLTRGLQRFIAQCARLHGSRIEEMPVAHRPRARGRSKYGLLDRALPGPHPTPQIPELVERGAMRLQHFWPELDARLQDQPWLGGDHFSVADIAAFVLVEFSAWVKLSPGEAHGALHRFHEAVKARPSGQV